MTFAFNLLNLPHPIHTLLRQQETSLHSCGPSWMLVLVQLAWHSRTLLDIVVHQLFCVHPGTGSQG